MTPRLIRGGHRRGGESPCMARQGAGCMIFVCGEVVWFFSLAHSGCMIFFSGGCITFLWQGFVTFCWEITWFLCEEVVWFLCVKRLRDFFGWRGCMIFCVKKFFSLKIVFWWIQLFWEKSVFWEVEWLCVWWACMLFLWGEVVWFCSLTHSSCMIYFSWRLHDFFLRRVCVIFSREVAWFFL